MKTRKTRKTRKTLKRTRKTRKTLKRTNKSIIYGGDKNDIKFIEEIINSIKNSYEYAYTYNNKDKYYTLESKLESKLGIILYKYILEVDKETLNKNTLIDNLYHNCVNDINSFITEILEIHKNIKFFSILESRFSTIKNLLIRKIEEYHVAVKKHFNTNYFHNNAYYLLLRSFYDFIRNMIHLILNESNFWTYTSKNGLIDNDIVREEVLPEYTPTVTYVPNNIFKRLPPPPKSQIPKHLDPRLKVNPPPNYDSLQKT